MTVRNDSAAYGGASSGVAPIAPHDIVSWGDGAVPHVVIVSGNQPPPWPPLHPPRIGIHGEKSVLTLVITDVCKLLISGH